MPVIASEISNVLFSPVPLSPYARRLRGDGLCGEENKPDISSNPFSSRRRCGIVIPVRLQSSQRASYAIPITERTVQLCPQQRNRCYALGALLVGVPSLFVGKLNAKKVQQPLGTTDLQFIRWDGADRRLAV
jgi:hypothetical protein